MSEGRAVYGGAHQRARRAALAELVDGTACPLCGQPMARGQALDLDHAVPVARGGEDGPRRLAHARCNRRAGARLRHGLPSLPVSLTDDAVRCAHHPDCRSIHSRAW